MSGFGSNIISIGKDPWGARDGSGAASRFIGSPVNRSDAAGAAGAGADSGHSQKFSPAAEDRKLPGIGLLIKAAQML